MNTKQRRTLQAIFQQPTPASLSWDAVLSLFEALGRVSLKDVGVGSA